MKLVALFLIALLLGGCATDYAKYAEATSKAATAKALEKPALAEQLARLAGDDPTARVAAIMAIAFMDKQAVKDEGVQIEAPYSVGKFMRDLTGLAVPLASVGSNFYAAKKGADVAIAAQNASRDVALGDQRARVDSLSVVGNAANSIVAGLAAPLGEAIKRPTTVVTVSGDNNAVATNQSSATRSNQTTTNTNNCPQTADARGGNGSNGGNSSSGAGSAGSGGTGGAGATGSASQAADCSAGK
jgi:hypothetical protein